MSAAGHARRTRRSSRWVSLALITGATTAQAQTACREREVEAELTRAMDHRQHSRESEAFAILQALWERCPSPRVRAQMALAEQGLGRWEDAYTHLREAMRNDLDPWIRARQAPLAQALEIIRGHLPHVEANANAMGVVNTPSAPRDPARSSVAAPREPPRDEPPARVSPVWSVLGWSAVGVGAVLGALGVWQAVAWSAQGDEATNATAASPGELGAWARFHESVNGDGRLSATGVCALADGSAAPDAAQVRSLCAENASRSGLAWGLGLGGAALVTTGVVMLVAAPRGARRASVRATPWLGANLRGASVAVDF